MTASNAQNLEVSAEDRLRADFYNFLGLLLAGPPDQMLLDQVAGLTGDDTELGQAVQAMARVAKVTKPAATSGATPMSTNGSASTLYWSPFSSG